jgi:hypothetical protein
LYIEELCFTIILVQKKLLTMDLRHWKSGVHGLCSAGNWNNGNPFAPGKRSKSGRKTGHCPWNSGIALKFIYGQPHLGISV